jgi:hypothetical protein
MVKTVWDCAVILRLCYNTEIVRTVLGHDCKKNKDGGLKGLVMEIEVKV